MAIVLKPLLLKYFHYLLNVSLASYYVERSLELEGNFVHSIKYDLYIMT